MKRQQKVPEEEVTLRCERPGLHEILLYLHIASNILSTRDRRINMGKTVMDSTLY